MFKALVKKTCIPANVFLAFEIEANAVCFIISIQDRKGLEQTEVANY